MKLSFKQNWKMMYHGIMSKWRKNYSISYRNSHQRCSINKAVLKNFAILIERHPCWSLFLIKLQAFRSATLIKRDSNTNVCPLRHIFSSLEFFWLRVLRHSRKIDKIHKDIKFLCITLWITILIFLIYIIH